MQTIANRIGIVKDRRRIKEAPKHHSQNANCPCCKPKLTYSKLSKELLTTEKILDVDLVQINPSYIKPFLKKISSNQIKIIMELFEQNKFKAYFSTILRGGVLLSDILQTKTDHLSQKKIIQKDIKEEYFKISLKSLSQKFPFLMTEDNLGQFFKDFIESNFKKLILENKSYFNNRINEKTRQNFNIMASILNGNAKSLPNIYRIVESSHLECNMMDSFMLLKIYSQLKEEELNAINKIICPLNIISWSQLFSVITITFTLTNIAAKEVSKFLEIILPIYSTLFIFIYVNLITLFFCSYLYSRDQSIVKRLIPYLLKEEEILTNFHSYFDSLQNILTNILDERNSKKSKFLEIQKAEEKNETSRIPHLPIQAHEKPMTSYEIQEFVGDFFEDILTDKTFIIDKTKRRNTTTLYDVSQTIKNQNKSENFKFYIKEFEQLYAFKNHVFKPIISEKKEPLWSYIDIEKEGFYKIWKEIPIPQMIKFKNAMDHFVTSNYNSSGIKYIGTNTKLGAKYTFELKINDDPARLFGFDIKIGPCVFYVFNKYEKKGLH